MPNYFNIGKIAATFGLQGELILVHKIGRVEALDKVKALFIEEKKNSFLPYFIESVRAKNREELYIKLEGISTKESASKLLTKQVYLDENRFREQVREGSLIYYLGFEVEDSHAGKLGSIAEIVEMPNQVLLKIYEGEHELLIPLNENTLRRIDRKTATLYVNLPEGLLDVYRS